MIPVLCQISPWVFEKIWNDPNVIFRGLGEGGKMILEKNLKHKILWHCPSNVNDIETKGEQSFDLGFVFDIEAK